MSNSLISHDPAARQAPLRARPNRPEASVYVVQHLSVNDEADALGAFIDRYLNDRPNLPPGQVLVLSPRRIFGNAVRDALNRRARNAMSFFWEDALDNSSAAEGFCLLTLLVNPTDRAAYRAWLGLGDATGNAAGYRRLRLVAESHDLDPIDVCQLISAGQLSLAHSGKIVARHNDLSQRLAALAGLEGLPLVEALWDQDDPKTHTIRVAAGTVALEYPQPSELHSELTQIVTQPELPDSGGDVIRVMSLHKSKGLTAELVVVAGCVAGAIPTMDSRLPQAEQDAVLKEQRRLFYVAMTRAKDTLILSSVTSLLLRDALRAGIPPAGVYTFQGQRHARLSASPFIDELGPARPATIRGADWRAALNI